MEPKLALNLSHEGIALLHRLPSGNWSEVGAVALDDPALAKNLAALRRTAVKFEGADFNTKLILPNSQVLYLEVHAPGPAKSEQKSQIAAALEGKTPYEINELSFDWAGDDPMVHVAVVANVTLEEAEDFAATHRFNPVSFTGRSSDEPDAWEPFFGPTEYSATLNTPDEAAPETAPIPAPPASTPPIPKPPVSEPPQPVPAASTPVAAPVSFSTRRESTAAPISNDAERPLDRVAPRIAISVEPPQKDLEKGPVPSLSATPAGQIPPAPKSITQTVRAPLILGKSGELGAADTAPKRRANYIIIAVIVLAVLGLLYAYSLLNRSADTTTSDATSLSTTSPLAGVRKDNRPQARPSDFAQSVASQTEINGDKGPVTLVRPQRRSIFEGGTDPEEGLPDTATTATDLSEQELADIAAAGLVPPTPEEIAESGDGLESGQLSSADLADLYATSGVLQGIASMRNPNPDQGRDDIFVAAIDRNLQANDATILPDFNTGVQDAAPAKKRSPVAADTVFNLDERGLVIATKAGALNPDGILVVLGKPPLAPPERPKTGAFAPPKPVALLKPRPRPGNLKTGEDAVFAQGGITLSRLRNMKPKPRPESAQIELAGGDTTVSDLAVLTSYQPAKRPKDFSSTVEKTRIQVALAIAAAQEQPKAKSKKTGKKKGVSNVDVAPILPTRASVAKTATIKNAINMSKVSLIGVYGSPAKRAALLRLPSGRFVRVKVGDRVNGGRVAAIDTSSLSYVKKGRNRVLKVPK